MKKHIYRALLSCSILVCAAVSASNAKAQDEKPDFATDSLTGDWRGLRTDLLNHGVDIQTLYTVDLWRNTSGGLKTGNAVVDNLDAIVRIDGEKLYGLPGSTVQLYFLNNQGGHPNHYLGSNGGIDNVEVETPTAQLYTAWVEQAAFDNRVSLKAGLYDLNTEFYVTDSSALFINPTYGIGTEMATTGQNGPSIFPAAALGVRLYAEPVQDVYIQAALLSGAPKDPESALKTRIKFEDKDGALNALEIGYKNDDIGHYALGVWQYTSRDDDWTDTNLSGDPQRKRNKGAYALLERTLYTDSTDDSRNLAGFIRLGFANQDVSQFSWSGSAGLVYSHVFDGRKDSQLGLGISNTANSGKFRRAASLSGEPLDKNETQVEFTYSDNVTPWLTLQPDFQFTANPGTAPSSSDAWTIGLRAKIRL